MVFVSLIFLGALTSLAQGHAPFDTPAAEYTVSEPFDAAWLADPLVQLGYFPVTLLGATPNNNADDDLAAINRAIRIARDYRYVCYFPAGTYEVSNTVIGALQSYDTGSVQNNSNNRWRNDRLRPVQLVGHCTSTARSIIKLKDGVFQHSNPSDLTIKPLLHMYAEMVSSASQLCWRDPNSTLTAFECADGGSSNPEHESSSSNFNAWVRNIDFDLGQNNTNAVAVRFAGAQGCSMEHSIITVNDGYAGITGGLGSGGGFYDITVQGGKYGFVGLQPQIQQNLFFTGARFFNQEIAVFRGASWVPITLVGLHIIKDTPVIFDDQLAASETRFNIGGNFVPVGGLSLIDAIIDINSSSSEIVFNVGGGNEGRNFYMENVYLRNAVNIVGAKIGSGDNIIYANPENPIDWIHIEEFASRDTGSTKFTIWDYGIPAVTSNYYINPNPTVVAGPPVDLTDKHTKPMKDGPCFLDNDVDIIDPVNGSDNLNDRALIQTAINTSVTGKILLPRGQFFLDGPLNLKSNTQLFGVSNSASVLVARANYFHVGNTNNPMITTDLDPNGQAYLADIYLQDDAASATSNSTTNNNKLSYIHWQQGEESVVKDVIIGANAFYPPSDPQRQLIENGYFVKIGRKGGGKFYNVTGEHTKLRALTRTDTHRLLLIDRTGMPIFFYSFNWERSGTSAAASAQVEIRNSNKITIFAAKTESGSSAGASANSPASTPYLINDSGEINMHGVTGVVHSLHKDDGTTGGLIEINNSCSIKISTARGYSQQEAQYLIIPDGIRENDLEGSGTDSAVALFKLTDLIYCNLIILPVELLDFTAKVADQNNARLDWKTANEQNSSHFTIQRSKDTQNWVNIHTMDAKGDSSVQEEYTYLDTRLARGRYFYRLKMVDTDRSFNYSNIREVLIEQDQQQMVWPNPANEQLNLYFPDTRIKSVSIYDMFGKRVQFETHRENVLLTSHTMDVKKLISGTYIVVIQTMDDLELLPFKFIKL